MNSAWDTVLCEARVWDACLCQRDYFEIDGELKSPSEMIAHIRNVILTQIPANHLRWKKFKRCALRLGKIARFVRLLFEEVTFRPQHSGAKRCRDHFLSLC